MNWRTLDLNLLVVFDTVARERSVTLAATLNMTSPASISLCCHRF